MTCSGCFKSGPRKAKAVKKKVEISMPFADELAR